MKLRRPWVLAAATSVAAALLAAWWFRPTVQPQGSAAGATSTRSEAAREKPGQSMDDLLAAGQNAQSAAAVAALPTTFEICGQRSFDTRSEKAAIEAERKEIARRGHEVLEQAGIRLAARADATERAAGLWAQYAAQQSRWSRSLEGTRKGNVEVIQVPPAPAEVSRPLAALIRFANESRQADALRLALGACASLRPSPSVCGSISWAQLAALEPDDAANWMSVAAQHRSGSSEQQAAFDRARAASRFDLRTQQAVGVLASQMDGLGDAPSRQAALLLAEQVGAWERLSRSTVSDLSARCSGPPNSAPAEPSRETCLALASRMAQSDDVMASGNGLELAASLAASAADRDRLLADRDALYRATNSTTETMVASGPYSCAAIAATRSRMQRVAQIGEAGVAREVLAREAQAAKPAAPPR